MKLKRFKFITPITQGVENISVKELRERIDQLYEDNKIFTAMDELKRVASK